MENKLMVKIGHKCKLWDVLSNDPYEGVLKDVLHGGWVEIQMGSRTIHINLAQIASIELVPQ